MQDAKERGKIFGMASQTSTTRGGAIRFLRTMAGLTLQQVAEGADTSVAYLSKVERDQLIPTDEYVAKVTTFVSGTVLGRAA